MWQKNTVGTHVRATSRRTLSWAVSEIVRTFEHGDLAKLKIGSGEHLAAILATAFLGTPPVGIDADGGPDLVFDLTRGHLLNRHARISSDAPTSGSPTSR